MKNFHFLFAAWIVAWAVFLGFQISVSSRISRLRDEIDRLKQQLQNH